MGCDFQVIAAAFVEIANQARSAELPVFAVVTFRNGGFGKPAELVQLGILKYNIIKSIFLPCEPVFVIFFCVNLLVKNEVLYD